MVCLRKNVQLSGWEQLDMFVHRSCDHCGAQQYMFVDLSLLWNSSLIAFFQERDLDITTTPIWGLEFAMNDRYVEIRLSDPWRIALCVVQDGDEFRLVVDDDLSVLD